MSPRSSEASSLPATDPVDYTALPILFVGADYSGDYAAANDDHQIVQRPLLERRRKRWARRSTH